jgi:DNA primase
MGDSVQQIKDRLSILDVISPYVELHRAGKNFKGKSPFTAEKTPSFYVSPDRGMYYCFSTSQGGDMFTFIQAMEGVDFRGALKLLADKAGVELVAEDPKKKTERERWYAAMQDATTYYAEQLEKTPAAKEYLENRGVTTATLQKWQIGFAPGPPAHGWRMVKDHLEGKGYTKDELFRVGLIKSTEGGKEPFDVFRDRIMFPLFDQNGKVVAFSGRILSRDKKSELLFGYDKAKHGIRQLNFSLIVEGQFDVVMAHQAGYTNTVAVSGTALTLHHVQLLERLSDRVVLALDADRAGIAAMKKAAELMLKRGIDVKVAEMPLGADPADIIKKDPNEVSACH